MSATNVSEISCIRPIIICTKRIVVSRCSCGTITNASTTTNVKFRRLNTRRLVHVSTKKEHTRVLIWMLHEVDQCGTNEKIATKAVNHPPFQQIFHRSSKSNRMKASRWWKSRNECMKKLESDRDSQISITSRLNKS